MQQPFKQAAYIEKICRVLLQNKFVTWNYLFQQTKLYDECLNYLFQLTKLYDECQLFKALNLNKISAHTNKTDTLNKSQKKKKKRTYIQDIQF